MPLWLPARLRSPFFGRIRSKPTSHSTGGLSHCQNCCTTASNNSRVAASPQIIFQTRGLIPEAPGALSFNPLTASSNSLRIGGAPSSSSSGRCGRRCTTEGDPVGCRPKSFAKWSRKTAPFSSGEVHFVPSGLVIMRFVAGVVFCRPFFRRETASQNFFVPEPCTFSCWNCSQIAATQRSLALATSVFICLRALRKRLVLARVRRPKQAAKAAFRSSIRGCSVLAAAENHPGCGLSFMGSLRHGFLHCAGQLFV